MKVTTAGQTVRAGRRGPPRRHGAVLHAYAVVQRPWFPRIEACWPSPDNRSRRQAAAAAAHAIGPYRPVRLVRPLWSTAPRWFVVRGGSEGQAPSVRVPVPAAGQLAAARRFARTMSGSRASRDSGKAGVSSVHRRYRAGRRVFPRSAPVAYDLPTRGHSRDRCHDRLGPPAGEPAADRRADRHRGPSAGPGDRPRHGPPTFPLTGLRNPSARIRHRAPDSRARHDPLPAASASDPRPRSPLLRPRPPIPSPVVHSPAPRPAVLSVSASRV
ncbi:hypothetical protein SALBM217S_06437 [Streptomyces griseoloalbus]